MQINGPDAVEQERRRLKRRVAATVLLQNSQACVLHHHKGEGEPGWLRDIRLTIERNAALLQKPERR